MSSSDKNCKPTSDAEDCPAGPLRGSTSEIVSIGAFSTAGFSFSTSGAFSVSTTSTTAGFSGTTAGTGSKVASESSTEEVPTVGVTIISSSSSSSTPSSMGGNKFEEEASIGAGSISISSSIVVTASSPLCFRPKILLSDLRAEAAPFLNRFLLEALTSLASERTLSSSSSSFAVVAGSAAPISFNIFFTLRSDTLHFGFSSSNNLTISLGSLDCVDSERENTQYVVG
mmetsp:Transcript_25715/g.39849  ORF Transcript_25715/g.39849 Transcript_25715/m.39849 type:complete len:228 (-) Transcript_25715:124-807(-)